MKLTRQITTTPLLSPGLLLGGYRRRNTAPLSSMRFFSHARHALAAIAQEEAIEEGTLLVPSYICAEAVVPLDAAGQAILYYPMKESLEPDWEWLERNLPPAAKALLLVHYFGFPNTIERALDFCQQHALLLIEDCAHSLLSSYEGKLTGTFGDFGFYSLRKFLPVPDGAILVRKVTSGDTEHPGPPERFGPPPYRALLRQLGKYFLVRGNAALGRSDSVNGRHSTAMPSHQNGSLMAAPRAMSRVSLGIMAALEPQMAEIAARRRENYTYLLENLSLGRRLKPLFPELPPGICPYACPALIVGRAPVVAQLRSRGITLGPWPELPAIVSRDPRYGVARRYADQLILLPIHQDLDTGSMRRIAAACHQVQQES